MIWGFGGMTVSNLVLSCAIGVLIALLPAVACCSNPAPAAGGACTVPGLRCEACRFGLSSLDAERRCCEPASINTFIESFFVSMLNTVDLLAAPLKPAFLFPGESFRPMDVAALAFKRLAITYVVTGLFFFRCACRSSKSALTWLILVARSASSVFFCLLLNASDSESLAGDSTELPSLSVLVTSSNGFSRLALSYCLALALLMLFSISFCLSLACKR